MPKQLLFIVSFLFIGSTYAQSLNDSLVYQLDSIRSADQEYRAQLAEIQTRFAKDTSELKQQLQIVFNKMHKADSLNLVAIEKILIQFGWPEPAVIGDEGCSTIFLVIQHADLPAQQKYLPLVHEAVKQKKLKSSSLALLEDRVALKEGRKQLYGTQLSWDIKTNTYTMQPIDDPDNVDKRRADVGLPPLAIYLEGFDLTWDLIQYKKDAGAPIKRKK
jgi:hypothetical protein